MAASVMSCPWEVIFTLALLVGNVTGVFEALYKFPQDTRDNSGDLYEVSQKFAKSAQNFCSLVSQKSKC